MKRYDTISDIFKERDIKRNEIIIREKNGRYSIRKPVMISDVINNNGIVSSYAINGKNIYKIVESSSSYKIWSKC